MTISLLLDPEGRLPPITQTRFTPCVSLVNFFSHFYIWFFLAFARERKDEEEEENNLPPNMSLEAK
jgi:hypothetical protein